MGRPSIEWLNARRELRPGKPLPRRDVASDNAQWRGMDTLDRAHAVVLAEFAEFRSWFRNLPSVESIMAGEQGEVF
jgi:hypothetical protein